MSAMTVILQCCYHVHTGSDSNAHAELTALHILQERGISLLLNQQKESRMTPQQLLGYHHLLRTNYRL
eukprot:6089742-Amphidinium_carterae.2